MDVEGGFYEAVVMCFAFGRVTAHHDTDRNNGAVENVSWDLMCTIRWVDIERYAKGDDELQTRGTTILLWLF